MILNAFLLALREIRNNLLRAGLTTLGIVIGVGAVILMVTLGAGANSRVTADIATMGNNLLVLIPGQRNGPPTATTPFDIATVDAIQREVPGLAEVVPELAVQGVAVSGNHNHSTQIDGTTNAYLASRNWPVLYGRDFSPAEILGGKSVCILGETVRRDLGRQAVLRLHLERVGRIEQLDIGRPLGVLAPVGPDIVAGDDEAFAALDMGVDAAAELRRRERSQQQVVGAGIHHAGDEAHRLLPGGHDDDDERVESRRALPQILDHLAQIAAGALHLA